MFSPLHRAFNHAAQPKRVDSALPSPPSLQPGPVVSFSGDDDFFDFDKFEQDFPQDDLPSPNQDHANYDNFVLMPKGFEFSDFAPVNISRYHLQPLVSQLNEISVDNKFPLDKKIDPAGFTTQRLGDYITQQPRYERLLETNPDGLRHGLETLVSLSKKLEVLPASHYLKGQNAYVQRHLFNHLLNYTLEKMLDNPAQTEPVAHKMLMGLNIMAKNAQQDPHLKIEEKILDHIDQHDQKLDLLQQALDTIGPDARNAVQFFSPDAYEPDPQLHPLVQNAQKQMQAIASATSPKAKKKALKELEENEQQLSALMRQEKMRQKELHYPVYASLSQHLRQKGCKGFTELYDSHPLKDVQGFRHLWTSQGGASEKVALTPFDLQTQCEPAWFLDHQSSPSKSSVAHSVSSSEISNERLSHQTDIEREVPAPENQAGSDSPSAIFGIPVASW